MARWSILSTTDKPFNRERPLVLANPDPTRYERVHNKYPIDLRTSGPNSEVRIIRKPRKIAV